MKAAYYFKDFFNTVKEGDSIIITVNWNGNVREVSYRNGMIYRKEYPYTWDDFFSCNTPVKIVGNE